MAEYSVRLADLRDVPQISAIENACFSLPHSEEQLLREINDDLHELLVAAGGEQVLGYVGLTHVIDEGYISNVAVAEHVRRQGIADALLHAVDKRAVELSLAFISLEVRESNLPAISLYSKHGYEPVAVQKDYYTMPKENAIIMTKQL